MGGCPSIGYDVCDRRLVVNQAEAATVRQIYQSYLKTGSVPKLKKDLDRDGVVSKIRVSRKGNRSGGQSFSRGALYELLSNPIYIGEIVTSESGIRVCMKRFWTESYGRRFKSVCEIAPSGRPSLEPKCHQVRSLERSSTKLASHSTSRQL